jgi:hypothetical protein
MKRRHAVLLLVALGCAGSMACGDRTAPTEPRPIAAMDEERVAPREAAVLLGQWTGTITFHPFGGMSPQGLNCDGSESVSVVLDQNESSVTGRLRTSCAGDLVINGVIQNGFLSGEMHRWGGLPVGNISGAASPSEIRFKTRTNFGLDPTHKGAPAVVSSEVVLHRESTGSRARPVLADVSRPSHAFDIPR